MSVALARTADAFKEPTDNYQLNTEQNNDSTQVIPYGNRCISVYSRDKDHRWNVNAASGSSTHYIKQDERLNIKLPFNSGNDIYFAARVNGTGTGTIEITAYKEDS